MALKEWNMSCHYLNGKTGRKEKQMGLNNTTKTVIVGAMLATVVLTSTGFDSPKNYEIVNETYTVKAGDTLWSIASKYVDKNSYGSRDCREFISGIKELNYDSVFSGRPHGMIFPGDELKINYWVKRGENQ